MDKRRIPLVPWGVRYARIVQGCTSVLNEQVSTYRSMPIRGGGVECLYVWILKNIILLCGGSIPSI